MFIFPRKMLGKVAMIKKLVAFEGMHEKWTCFYSSLMVLAENVIRAMIAAPTPRQSRLITDAVSVRVKPFSPLMI